MTVTYDLSNNIGKVRFYAGDTSTDSPWLQDEEIQLYLDAHSSETEVVKLSAIDAISAVILRMGMTGDLKSDWLEVSYADTISQLKQQRLTLALETATISLGATAKPVYRTDSLQTEPPEDWT